MEKWNWMLDEHSVGTVSVTYGLEQKIMGLISHCLAVSYSPKTRTISHSFIGISTEIEWRVKWNDCNKLPSLCNKKKLLQAGNHRLSASTRGRSNAFKLQQGGWVSPKYSVGKDSNARGWDTWGAFGTSSLAPASGRGWSTQRLLGPWLPVPGWSFATIWGKM